MNLSTPVQCLSLCAMSLKQRQRCIKRARPHTHPVALRRVVTIHNHPENLKLPSRLNHLRLELPDVEVADISKYFNEVFAYIEEAKVKKHGAW